jgi:hypothetical protein
MTEGCSGRSGLLRVLEPRLVASSGSGHCQSWTAGPSKPIAYWQHVSLVQSPDSCHNGDPTRGQVRGATTGGITKVGAAQHSSVEPNKRRRPGRGGFLPWGFWTGCNCGEARSRVCPLHRLRKMVRAVSSGASGRCAGFLGVLMSEDLRTHDNERPLHQTAHSIPLGIGRWPRAAQAVLGFC